MNKPEWLDEHASKEWDRVAPQLINLGLLTELDLGMFVAYVTAVSDVIQLREKIEETGWAVQTADGSSQKRHPLAASLREAYERLRSAASEFGLTPASRTRLAPPGKKDGTDPLENLKQRQRQRRERGA